MMQRWLILILMLVGLSVFAFLLVRSRADETSAVSASAVQPDEPRTPPGPRAPVLVELFTSEGCSSCPPADELLRRMEQTQPVAGAEVIALEQHVDYWNRLGWADPFSAPQFSARQSDYADHFNSTSVYTPQMVVDGQSEFPGGNQERARAAIARAAAAPKAVISLTRVGPQRADGAALAVTVDKLPALRGGDTSAVWLAITEEGLRTDVPRGENAGRTLAHASIVRQLTPLGQLDTRGGGPFSAQPSVTFGARWQPRRLRAVVFVQEHTSHRILGVATLKLAAE